MVRLVIWGAHYAVIVMIIDIIQHNKMYFEFQNLSPLGMLMSVLLGLILLRTFQVFNLLYFNISSIGLQPFFRNHLNLLCFYALCYRDMSIRLLTYESVAYSPCSTNSARLWHSLALTASCSVWLPSFSFYIIKEVDEQADTNTTTNIQTSVPAMLPNGQFSRKQ